MKEPETSIKQEKVMEELVLVNEYDQVIGVGEKLQTHLSGALHRAFSIYIFDSAGQLLLQKRSSTKYHSPGLWSNTCCGHPRLGESIEKASRRRLSEEMGFECELSEVFDFIYHAKLENGLYEHEFDHVVIGRFDGSPTPNRDEVDEWQWIDLETLQLEMGQSPNDFTCWFKLALDLLLLKIEPAALSSTTKRPQIDG